MNQRHCYTYILECADGTFYTGWTNSVEKRLSRHNAGKGAKYTKGRLPVNLVGLWGFETKSQAMKFELWIKGLTRKEKERLLREGAGPIFQFDEMTFKD